MSGRKGWMVQPYCPALPPVQSVPQLAGWSLPADAAVSDATEAKCNVRGAVTTYEYEAPNLPQPTTVMTAARSRPYACQSAHRSRTQQHVCSTTA